MFYLYCYSYCKHQSIIVRDVWQISGNLAQNQPFSHLWEVSALIKVHSGSGTKDSRFFTYLLLLFFDGIAIILRECYFQSYS